MIYKEILTSFEKENRLRRIPGSQNGLDLVSNDYMGLGKRFAEYIPEFQKRFQDAPMSASASRLLQRSQEIHSQLETYLDCLYGKRTLLLNSGYHANVGALSALSVPGTLVVSDKLAHASMIDGIRLGQGDSARFPHNDMVKLRQILEKKASVYKTVVLATESVFSMDGDISPLNDLVEIKKEFPNVLLYIDEAHAFGVFGEKGLGVAEDLHLMKEIDLLVITLGKAAAGYGAFIATSPLLHSYLLNSARSFIFSTALPPSMAAWDLLMIEKLTGMMEEREHLRKLSGWFRNELEKLTEIKSQSASQIIPVHAGSAEKAIKMAESLRDEGIDALPIRRPTVAAGTERLRISLSADLTRDDLKPVLSVLGKLV